MFACVRACVRACVCESAGWVRTGEDVEVVSVICKWFLNKFYDCNAFLVLM